MVTDMNRFPVARWDHAPYIYAQGGWNRMREIDCCARVPREFMGMIGSLDVSNQVHQMQGSYVW